MLEVRNFLENEIYSNTYEYLELIRFKDSVFEGNLKQFYLQPFNQKLITKYFDDWKTDDFIRDC